MFWILIKWCNIIVKRLEFLFLLLVLCVLRCLFWVYGFFLIWGGLYVVIFFEVIGFVVCVGVIGFDGGFLRGIGDIKVLLWYSFVYILKINIKLLIK